MKTATNHAVKPQTCLVEGCDRATEKVGDLCCATHWKLAPRHLRQLLIREQKARESKTKRDRVMGAAAAVLFHLNNLKVVLP